MVDLSGVREVDSTGLGELIELHQRLLRGGGVLAIARPSATVKRLLDTTRLCRFFTVLEDEMAIQEFMGLAAG